MRNWRKYRRLTGQERAILHRAFFLLPLVSLGLRYLGIRRVQKVLARTAPPPAAGESPPVGMARTAAEMIGVAAARLPLRATCLERSLTLWWLLRRRGIDGELHIGVRPRTAGVEAHAWIECAGAVLNDRPDVRDRFAAFHNPI